MLHLNGGLRFLCVYKKHGVAEFLLDSLLKMEPPPSPPLHAQFFHFCFEFDILNHFQTAFYASSKMIDLHNEKLEWNTCSRILSRRSRATALIIEVAD